MADTLIELTDRANALKAQGKLTEAIDVYAEAVRAWPNSGIAEHNLAAALGDGGRHAEAEQHLRKAFTKGVDAPETWLVLARTMQNLFRQDEAETAFREALKRRPGMFDAHRELAQLIWMRTGDAQAALAPLEAAIAAMPGDPALKLLKAKTLEFTGDLDGGYRELAAMLSQFPDESALLVPASHLAVMTGRTQAAVEHAERSVRARPEDPLSLAALAFALLAAGDAPRAAEIAARFRAQQPLDQHAIALQATAWRMMDDPRYRSLYDYDAFVRPYRIDAPQGWRDRDHYLKELAEGLKTVHPYKTHPFGQSVRHGSQLPDLLAVDHPAIRAFPQAIAGPVAAHLEHLGKGDDPVRARNTGRWRIHGIWSVWLSPGGFHADHVHPAGWLSSACYIELPAAVNAGGKEGWIKYGEPGLATAPPLGPEHFIRPEPGVLALFPSYMWHGTIPFSGDQPRLTVALDIVPD